MLLKFIKLCIIFILIGGGIILYNKPTVRNTIISYLHVLPDIPDVKGISTDKVGGISKQLKSEIDNSINHVQKQALNIKIGDILNYFNKSQKITKDFRDFQDYVKDQVSNFGKK